LTLPKRVGSFKFTRFDDLITRQPGGVNESCRGAGVVPSGIRGRPLLARMHTVHSMTGTGLQSRPKAVHRALRHIRMHVSRRMKSRQSQGVPAGACQSRLGGVAGGLRSATVATVFGLIMRRPILTRVVHVNDAHVARHRKRHYTTQSAPARPSRHPSRLADLSLCQGRRAWPVFRENYDGRHEARR
jgi:hypothetical protein